MPRYAIIQQGNNRVLNVELWDAPPTARPSQYVVEDTAGVASPGMTYEGGVFVAEPPPPPPPPDTELDALDTILNKADGDISAGELKTVVLGALRRMRSRNRL